MPALFWLGLAACALLFMLVPGIDLAFSRLFFRDGTGFYLRNDPSLVFARDAIDWISRFISVLLVALVAWASVARTGRLAGRRREFVYLLLVLALGPGLLVNGILKEHVERARPNEVQEFGGPRHFTPPFLPTHECSTNCSFVSGHASAAFYVLALAFIAPAPWRRLWLAAGIVAGSAAGLMRIMQGEHFLSDIVFAFFAVYLVAALVHRLLFGVDAGSALQASRRSDSTSP